MRLFSSCGLFEAWVEIEGEELEVFDLTQDSLDNGTPRSQGYICSVDGKIWKLRIDCLDYKSLAESADYQDIKVYLLVDGIRQSPLDSRTKRNKSIICIDEVWVDGDVKSSLEFRPADLIEAEAAPSQNTSNSLGTIDIRLCRIAQDKAAKRLVDSGGQRHFGGKTKQGGRVRGPISERAKKGGLSSLTGYSMHSLADKGGRTGGGGRMIVQHPEDKIGKPYRVLVFKYAKKEVLMAQGIVPREIDASAGTAATQSKKDDIVDLHSASEEDGSDDDPDSDDTSDTSESIKSELRSETGGTEQAGEASGGEGESEAVVAQQETLKEIKEMEERLALLRQKALQTSQNRNSRTPAVEHAPPSTQETDDKLEIQRKIKRRMNRRLRKREREDGGWVDLTMEEDSD